MLAGRHRKGDAMLGHYCSLVAAVRKKLNKVATKKLKFSEELNPGI